MKKLFQFIAVCLLINVSAFSQNKYPAIVELSGDTVVAITISQMDTISERLADCERISLADSIIASKSKENNVFRELLDTLNVQIVYLKENNADFDRIVRFQDMKLENKDQEIAGLKRKNRNNLWIGVPVSFGFGSLVGLLVGLFAVR